MVFIYRLTQLYNTSQFLSLVILCILIPARILAGFYFYVTMAGRSTRTYMFRTKKWNENKPISFP
jgi:hypothetical protein